MLEHESKTAIKSLWREIPIYGYSHTPKIVIICDCSINDIERNLHKICSMRFLTLKIMLCLLLSLIISRIEANTNNYSISGRISDERTGSPLPGASILIKGTYLWAVSDQKGEFTIQGIQAGTPFSGQDSAGRKPAGQHLRAACGGKNRVGGGSLRHRFGA